MTDAVTELRERVPRKPLAAIGFCFGGGMIWRLLASREPRLWRRRRSRPAPRAGRASTAAGRRSLGIYGGLDTRVKARRDAAKAALEAARLKHEILTFVPGRITRSSTTPGPASTPPAAEEAWRRVVGWFDDACDRRRRH